MLQYKLRTTGRYRGTAVRTLFDAYLRQLSKLDSSLQSIDNIIDIVIFEFGAAWIALDPAAG